MSSKIAIIGAGPVGGILAAHLIQHGQDVTLIDILKPHMEKIRSDGLQIRGMEPQKYPCFFHLFVHRSSRPSL